MLYIAKIENAKKLHLFHPKPCKPSAHQCLSRVNFRVNFNKKVKNEKMQNKKVKNEKIKKRDVH